jgi:hypothetical protein
MNFKSKNLSALLIIIPAVIIFLIALIPTIKYQWPLSYDVFTHIRYAQLYSSFEYIDPLYIIYLGKGVGTGGIPSIYPPLFHFLIIFIGALFKTDYFQVARFLQPVLAGLIILSITYVGSKFYGIITGVSAGFLVLSSNLLTRIVLPLPENFALIFVPLVIYFSYLSIKSKERKYAIISGLLFLITALSHPGVIIPIFLVVTIYTVFILLFYRECKLVVNYLLWILIPLTSLILIVTTILFIAPKLSLITLAQDFLRLFNSGSRPLGILHYLYQWGILVSIFSLVGIIISLKKRNPLNFLLIIWFVVVFLLSFTYLIGIPIISYRLLIYMLIPLSILGGLAITSIASKLDERKKTKIFNIKISTIFLVLIFSLCTLQGVLTLENPKNFIFKSESDNQFGNIIIAPPTNSEVEVINWFKQNGDKNKSVVISNNYFGRVLLVTTGQPIDIYDFDDILKGKTTLKNLRGYNVGYLVYDKTLNFTSSNSTPDVVVYGQSPLFYYNTNIGIDNMVPNYAKKVYENKDYIIYEVS